ncbi:MAG: DMT family transporter [Desulfobacterota bacterium]|nr:DMT family transporter [Thermodesulfobacteriota bacterium]
MTPLSILLVLLSALIHASWNFFSKRENLPVSFFFQVFLWGTLIGFPGLILFGNLYEALQKAPLSLVGLTLLSGLFETIYFICLIEAYQQGPLSLVYPLSRSAPLFTQLWAYWWIGEKVSSKGAFGIGLVMAGLLCLSLERDPEKVPPLLSRGKGKPYLLALAAGLASSIYSVIDKAGVQWIHPLPYLWLINLWMTLFTGIYLLSRKEYAVLRPWAISKGSLFVVLLLQNGAYLLILLAMTMSKVSYVVAFRQAGALFGALMGILWLKEKDWKVRLGGVLLLTIGLVMIGQEG